MKRILRSPFVAALVGGGVVAAALFIFGVAGNSPTSTTVVQQTPLAQRPVTQRAGLTPHQIYERAAPGVAFIKSQITQTTQSPFGFGLPQRQQGTATGSGFVVDKDGHILTNAHVVEGASDIEVSFENDKTVKAKVLGRDPSNDIALLKVDPDGLDLHPLPLGNDSSVKVGDPVLAIGNPFGLDRTLTTGVVSALQRKIQAPNGFSIDHVLQTDAAVNPGNSGGPLLDGAGRVIGINSQIETGGSGSNGNIGIAFAVPIDTAKKDLPALQKGNVARAYLGIEGLTINKDLAPLGLEAKQGVLVQKAPAGGPAAKAGIHGGHVQAQLEGQPIELGGDVITKIDGKEIKSIEQVVTLIDSKKPGDQVELTYEREGKAHAVKITLGTRPTHVQTQ